MLKSIAAVIAMAVLPLGNAFAIVNLNTAQQSELQLIKGLDKHKAKAIIEYRARNGRFSSVDELEKVPGFDRGLVESVKTQVALSGDAYVAPPKAQVKPARPVRNNAAK